MQSQLATKSGASKQAVNKKSHTPCEDTGSMDLSEIPRQARDVARRANKKLGFTLVELSIVLVIIGLLIGGILVGQNLIDSAKLQNEVRKISQWSIAVTMFKDKFRQYPGDSVLFNPAGDNDEESSLAGSCPASAVYEPFSTWSHLSQAGMLGGKNYTYTSENFCANSYKEMAPMPDFKNYDGSDLPSYIQASRSGFEFDEKRYEYLIYNYYQFYDLLAIDKKLDDGVPSQLNGRISSFTKILGTDCTDSAVADEIANVPEISSKAEVICDASFYFNQYEIYTAN